MSNDFNRVLDKTVTLASRHDYIAQSGAPGIFAEQTNSIIAKLDGIKLPGFVQNAVAEFGGAGVMGAGTTARYSAANDASLLVASRPGPTNGFKPGGYTNG